MKKRMALAALWARCLDAALTSISASARRCAAQMKLPANWVSITPATITAVRRPNSDCGRMRASQRPARGAASMARARACSDIAGAHIGGEHIAGAAHRLDQQGLL